MNLASFKLEKYQDQLVELIKLLVSQKPLNKKTYLKLTKQFTKENGDIFSKDELIFAYKKLAGQYGIAPYDENFISQIKMKPVRTMSGVTVVTVLTKPFPCPGKCIFCPSDIRMPKSYLSSEPGAQRAERNWFDPYLQVYNRLLAIKNIGHDISKVELIILGGTWSFYPEEYQLWFIKECFKALNDFGIKDGRKKILENYQRLSVKLKTSDEPEKNKLRFVGEEIQAEKTKRNYNQLIADFYIEPEKKFGVDKIQTAIWQELEFEQQKNETAGCRCVGLVIETRPDYLTQAEAIKIRKLGCTKVQIGVQSLSDLVLKKNHRGHSVAATREAFKILRQTGFKIHAHLMANLYGSSVAKDKADFKKLFTDPDFKPDELKIYPCSLIASAELMKYYQQGLWKPYSHEELLEVVSFCIKNTPEYCRLTRIIRDIPSTEIVVGNKKTNFRQIAEADLQKLGERSVDIRAREIRLQKFVKEDIKFRVVSYLTSVSEEKFFQFVVDKDGQEKLLAFLRLSLPTKKPFIKELVGSAIIREIHVYGATVNVGEEAGGRAQHLGLGTKLIEQAKKIAWENNFKNLSVISAVGTRQYYRDRGFEDGKLYQTILC